MAVFSVAIGATGLPANQLTPHAKPERFRMAPVPPGEGGALLITAPPELCANGANEFHLHYMDDSSTHIVLELTAGPSACEWTVSNLPEGSYEAWIQRAPNGRILARGGGEVATGATGVISMQSPAMEVEGRVTRNGLPPQNLLLRFNIHSGASGFGADAPLSADGSYHVTLDGRIDRYCAEFKAPQPANVLRKCETFQAGLQRFDIDVAPGVIHLTAPRIDNAAVSEWSHIHVVRQSSVSQSDVLMAWQHEQTSFKSKDGFRAIYIGLPSGDYVLYTTSGTDPTASGVRRVSLSPEQETVAIELSIRTDHQR